MSTGETLTFDIQKNPNPATASEREALLQNPGFGRIFTDHMATIRYSQDRGWHSAKIEPRKALALDPATVVLHYAQEIFEGMKAYHLPDGGAALFRPSANARRFQNSAERLAMPRLPEELFVQSVRELVKIDREWIPTAEGASLYLRPFLIGTEVALGTKPSAEYIYCVIASPVASFSRAAGRPSRSGSPRISPARLQAAPGLPSVAAIMPQASQHLPKASVKAAIRSYSSMPSRSVGSRSLAA